MTSPPMVGLNMSMSAAESFSVYTNYADALEAAGGIPLCFPPLRDTKHIRQVVKMLAGFLFIGGKDYHPQHYGGKAQDLDELLEERRDTFDVALAREILGKTSLPVLGICGGAQLLNIALGGGLVQDIESQWKEHSAKEALAHRDGGQHLVHILSDSLLFRVLKEETIITNSFHHQAINPHGVATGLRAVAHTEDGVVEAIEATDSRTRFLLGVQWHPERMTNKNSLDLFGAFIRAAQAHRSAAEGKVPRTAEQNHGSWGLEA